MEKEVTILIPALNEEKTIGICIDKAKRYMKEHNIEGEILIADNGSTDNTIKIAEEKGARIVNVKEKGYGNALRTGAKYAKGKYTIMGDADDSYDFLELDGFIENLRNGYELVMGNRYGKTMQKGAMPISHKYIGTPMLTFLINKKYKTKLNDINCGLRGYVTKKVIELPCEAEGMEYASEMIIKSQKANLKITEVPINFYKDARDRKPHLKTVRDGFRYLNVILFKN